MNRSDFEAAAAFKERLDASKRARLENYIDSYAKADANLARSEAFNALVYGLTLAVRAAPDFLTDLDIDAAARLILDQLPVR